MKKTTLFKSAVLLSSCLLMGSVQAEAPSGQALAYTCAGCHGTDGSSTGPATPSIGGMSETFLIESMMAYKNEERPSTIMARIAKGYSEADIEAMSKFFAKQKFISAEQDFDKALAAKGAKIHEKSCEKCHADAGTDPDDDSGFLQGQWKIYLNDSFSDFHSGKREMTKKMKKKFDKVAKDPENLKALIEYYAGK